MYCCTFDTKVTSHRLRFLIGARLFLLAVFVHTNYQACSAYISGVTSSLSANRTEITFGHAEVKSTYLLHSRLRAAPPSLRSTNESLVEAGENGVEELHGCTPPPYIRMIK